VDCGPHTASCSCAGQPAETGLPGAHVLAVVPAHRGTYAEVRGRCWLQISSRNALQKQRQTRVNGSLDDSLFRVYPGLGSSKRHRDSVLWRPKATIHGGKAQGGVMSATRRNGLSREDRVACLARCPVRKTRHVRDEIIGRVLTNGSRSGLRKTVLFTDGSEQVASVGTRQSPRPVMWNMRRTGSGGSSVHDGNDRGDILAKPKKLQNAPKRVWRRETLHILEGRVSPRPNAEGRGVRIEPERVPGLRAATPPSNRARCGYTLRQSRLADIGRIHLGARLPSLR
jgi:hypothetical protein